MKIINLPLKESDLENLVAGEEVYLNGKIYTARDAAHKKMLELLDNNLPLPFEIKDQVIYYVGPVFNSEGKIISAGPTTSTRMDQYTVRFLNLGLKGMIGKGYRSEEVKNAIIKNKACYFVAVGGAGALLADCIKKVRPVAFSELLSEAIYELEIEHFPVFVGINPYGEDIYE